jgi:iron(III) transport system substrate-binding protein
VTYLRERGIRAVALSAAALLLAAVAAGSAAARTDNTDSSRSEAAATPLSNLISAAKKEGSVTWYSGDSPDLLAAEGAAFTQKYGINVNLLRLNVTELESRLAGEEQTKVRSADVLTLADPTIFKTSASWFTVLNATVLPGMSSYPKLGLRKNFVLLRDSPGVILYNTSLVPADHAPKTWTDILDPLFKGHCVLDDPRSSPTYMGWAKVMLIRFGASYLRAIGGMNCQLAQSGAPAAQELAAGAAYINFPARTVNSASIRAQGAPLSYHVPPGFSTGAAIESGILRNAPHPAAARLFQLFEMSKQGVAAVCTKAEVSVFYRAGTIPNCLPLTKNWKLPDYTVTPALQAQILSLLGIG